MFGTLTDRFSEAFRKVSGRGRITESNVREAMDDVRTALLEADVHYEVAREFCDHVLQKSLGEEVLGSLKPDQQIVKFVYDELIDLMGPVDTHLLYVDPGPTVVMMCGLQGSGKTTTCGKLAGYLRKRGKTVMLAAADLQRPAAVQQLDVLAGQVREGVEGGQDGDEQRGVHFYAEADKVAEYGKAVGAAVDVCRNAVSAARQRGIDVVILDTAGRLHVNDELMGELKRVNQAVNPHQVYLVIDAMTGQDAVNSAKAFNEQLELDGVVLTKFDSDTRGGAALSVKKITGAPIKFIGTGEKLDALEEFHPDRVASRMLGMGDVISLVEKAQEQVSEEEAAALQEKMSKGQLTMDDFLKQLKSIRKMGSMKSLLGMLPGIGNQLKDMNLDDKQVNRTEAIIQSMTPRERREVGVINNSRRRRIAKGSGTSVGEVGQLLKGFEAVSQMSKQVSGMGMAGRLSALSSMGQAMPGMMTGKGGRAGLAGFGKAAKPQRRGVKQRKRKSR